MRVVIRCCVFAIAALGASASGMASAQISERFIPGPIVAEVLEVIDGDTLSVRVRPWLYTQVATRVRLRGVDAPEINRADCPGEAALGTAALELVTQMLVGETPLVVVTIRDIAPDKFSGRVVASASTLEGEDIASALLEQGLAREYDGGTRASWCDG